MATVTEIVFTRQERLRAWLRQNGLYQSDLARKLGITRMYCSKLLNQDTLPTAKHAMFLSLGIPEDLLPRLEDKKPGPARRGNPAMLENIAHSPANPR